MNSLNIDNIKKLIAMSLDEDISSGDVTTNALVDDKIAGKAYIKAKEPCVMAGLFLAPMLFEALGSETQIQTFCEDGDDIAAGTKVMEIMGSLKSILLVERTLLNLLQRMCGAATMTRKYVKATGGKAVILDTRKTTPLWRDLEKYAVRTAGATNHRFGLFDQVLIKENHLKVVEQSEENYVEAAIKKCREANPGMFVEVEVKDEQEAKAAAEAGADRMLLDNMTNEQMADIVKKYGANIETEASGGVTYERIASLSETGVDFISVGALTHSVPSSDLSLIIE